MITITRVAVALLATMPVIASMDGRVLASEGRRPVPDIRFLDDSGRERSISEFRGKPLLLVPMYTKCKASCSNLVSGVKSAILSSKLDPNDYSVLLFSFDSSDTATELTEFRKEHVIPLSWRIGTANEGRVRALMEGIGFRYAAADGQFSHGNVVAVIAPDLSLAKSVYGTRFPAGQLEDAVAVANGRYDWRGWYRYAFPLFLFGFTLSTAYLVSLLLQRRRRMS